MKYLVKIKKSSLTPRLIVWIRCIPREHRHSRERLRSGVIEYFFRFEEDAIAFKLKFGTYD